jgi:hypothetical protein
MGITEDSDAAVVLVSEQTGAISLAVGGAMEFGLTVAQLTDRLNSLFGRFHLTPQPPAQQPETHLQDRAD